MEKQEYPAGIKWTRQRKDVYQILLEATEPLSAVQIYQRLEDSAGQPGYAVSTIYRLLAAVEEKNLLIKSSWMGEDTLVYELNRGEHTHYAVCLGCHKRVPLQQCPFAHMHPQLPQTQGDFEITGHKLELYGYCKECKEKLL
ncbi:MAG: transcriptional repressor [Lachnospiraceae bacterium]|nr:transcriptional repressor [Lachnospiraceae bacterium]